MLSRSKGLFLGERYSEIRFGLLLVIILFAVNLPYSISTWNNVWYSDDYQLISGFYFKQLLSDNIYSTVLDHFEVRSDGHLVPVHYFFNYIAGIIDSFVLWHVIVISFHVAASFLVYKFAHTVGFSRVVSTVSAFIYSINYSIHIKVLTWNIWHSFVVNTITGLMMLINIYMIIKSRDLGDNESYTKNSIYVFLLGLLTVFNMETGLLFSLLGMFILSYHYLKKRKDAMVFVKLVIAVALPVILYSTIAMYQTSTPFPLLKNRVVSENIESEGLDQNGLITYLRSRKAPRTIDAYLIRSVELALASINISSIEYSIKYLLKAGYVDYNLIKNKLYDNAKALAIIAVFFLVFMLIYILRNYKLFFKDKLAVEMSVLYAICFISFVVIFHRKDIAIILAIFSSIVLSHVICVLYYEHKKIQSIIVLLLLITPTLLYAMTGFEYVYEMYPKTERKDIYQEFEKGVGDYEFDDGSILFKDGLEEMVYIRRLKGDFYWHYILANKTEMLKNEYFIRNKEKSFDKFMPDIHKQFLADF